MNKPNEYRAFMIQEPVIYGCTYNPNDGFSTPCSLIYGRDPQNPNEDYPNIMWSVRVELEARLNRLMAFVPPELTKSPVVV